MAIDNFEPLTRTIEIQTAVIHTRGRYAGSIEVLMLITDGRLSNLALDEFYLSLDQSRHLLKPASREFFNGQLRLLYFSEEIQHTGRPPKMVQLHWGDDNPGESAGMILDFRTAED